MVQLVIQSSYYWLIIDKNNTDQLVCVCVRFGELIKNTKIVRMPLIVLVE